MVRSNPIDVELDSILKDFKKFKVLGRQTSK